MSLNWTVSLFGGFWGANLQKGESANYIGKYFKALILLLLVSISMVTGAGTAAFSPAAPSSWLHQQWLRLQRYYIDCALHTF